MKKQPLILSVILLLSLSACSRSGSDDSTLLKLYDDNSKFVTSGYGEEDSFPLPTYRHKKNGEAPYVELSQFFSITNEMFHNAVDYTAMTSVRLKQYDSYVEKVSDHKYGIYSESVLGALIDTKENILNIKRFDYMNAQVDSFNGTLRMDIANPSSSDDSLVHGSHRSTYLGEFKEEVYDLDDYGMDIVELDDKVYMPAQLLSTICLRGLGVDFVYNGNDFFLSSSVTSEATFPQPEAMGSFRSSNNTFEVEGVLYSPVTPLSGEAHRYVGQLGENTYAIFSLDNDGKGYVFTASSPDTRSSETPKYKLSWEEKDKGIYLTFYSKNPATDEFNNRGHIMRISTNETFFNKKNRSEALSIFNYQLLRFQIDNFYGLKDELTAKHGFTDFDTFVTNKGLKDKLLSTDANEYDRGLSEFLMKYIDDGHTRYTDRSLFAKDNVSASDLINQYSGPRRTALFNKIDEYSNYRKTVLGEDVNPIGLSMKDETAVIRFDAFSHLLPIITDPGETMDYLDIPTAMENSTPYGFIKSFEEIDKHSEIKNVVLDLTCNGGGMVLTLPFLSSYFTKDPTLYLRDNLEGVVRELHYSVDLNCDGIYGGEGDCLADKYNFYLLTSDFSFSCGSAYPTMAHIAGVDIIGKKCAGGACNVAGFADACGSIYTLSAPQQIGYLDANGNFVNDDAGIPVTHELDKESWYDLTKLNAAIEGWSSH